MSAWLMMQAMAQQSAQQQQLAQQNEIARQKQVGVIQQGLSSETEALLQDFGRRQAMAGSSIAPPMSTMSGGFSNPIVTGSGMLKAA